MNLGAFSISLNVKDLMVSKKFYMKLGFSILGGKEEHGYLIMKNGDAVIGLFQGMFEKNILTFNPGWDQNANKLEEYSDVREIHEAVKNKEISTEQEALTGEEGPGSFVIVDPDGNPILIDQHV